MPSIRDSSRGGRRPRRPIALAALRGFDAAARELSFTRAAQQLALTQSAISRQIGTLERQVGRALFTRRTRALALTAAGAQLHAVVGRVLADIDRCVDTIRGDDRPPRVSLTTYASFASLWLVPRLAAFQHAHPEIEIRIDASDRAVDLLAEGIDIAIRRGPPRLAGHAHATLLGDEYASPLLSPQLLARLQPTLALPADLLRLPLIEIDEPRAIAQAASWARWFEHAGLALPAASGGRLGFGYIDQAMQAAVRGQGVVMGRTALADELLATGQLLEPFPALRMATGYGSWLIVNPARADAPEVAAFAGWLAQEFARGPQTAG